MVKKAKKKVKKKAKKKKRRGGITSLQRKFCDILLLMEISGKANQAQAYKLAGSKCTGKTLEQEASRTARKPQVLEYLSQGRARVKRVVEKSEAEIVTQFEKLGFSELTDYVTWGEDGLELKPSSHIPKDKIPALKSIVIDEHEYENKKGKKGLTRQIKIELHSPKGALDSLAKIKGMMKVEVTGVGGEPIPVSIVDYSKVDLDSMKPNEPT